eukprot:3117941-Amphidinium_carterae.2
MTPVSSCHERWGVVAKPCLVSLLSAWCAFSLAMRMMKASSCANVAGCQMSCILTSSWGSTSLMNCLMVLTVYCLGGVRPSCWRNAVGFNFTVMVVAGPISMIRASWLTLALGPARCQTKALRSAVCVLPPSVMRSSSPSSTGSGSSSGFLPFADVMMICVWLELWSLRYSWSTAAVSCASATPGAPSTS